MNLTTNDFIKALTKRLIYRFVTLPSYLFVFIPWIFVFLITQTNYGVTHEVASALAYLAGKPADSVLTGHDAIRIIAIIFFAANIVFEIFYAVTNRQRRWQFYKVEGITKIILICVGWLAFILLAPEVIGIAAVFIIIGLFLVGTEFLLTWFFNNAKPSLPSQRIR